MRGDDEQQNHMFSYLSPEARVRKDHPLRAIRAMVDEVLSQLSRRFDTMYARVGRPSIAPEKLLRAQLLQMVAKMTVMATVASAGRDQQETPGDHQPAKSADIS